MTLDVAGVVGASATRVRVPLMRPFVTSAGTWHKRDAWIVQLVDRDGRTGVGEAGLEPGADAAALDRLRQAMDAALSGLAAAGALERWLGAAPPIGSDAQIGRSVAAAFAGAALDLGLLALVSDDQAPTVAVNATIATEDRAQTVDDARAAVGLGYTSIKLKGGREPSTAALVARLQAVRDAVGPDVGLRLDVNGAWDPATARQRLAALEPIGLEYVEQPIQPGDPADLARLRRASPVPIAADESVHSLASAQALLVAGAVDVLVVKPGRVGGPVVAAAIARAATAAGVGAVISTLLDTGVGLSTALRVAAITPGPAHGLATGDLLRHDLVDQPLAVHEGRIRVPGLEPIVLDDRAVARYAVERIECSL